MLKKNKLFFNLKKYWFYQDKVYFLRYVILTHGIRIKDKQIKEVKNWPKLKLVQDI